ncbi:MAG: N-acetylmuramoyl-L-alanine amidase [Desulfobacteria bacterium]
MTIERPKKIPLLQICCSAIFLFLFVSLLNGCAHAATIENNYFSAVRSYKKLLKSPTQRKYRENWINIVNKFRAVYDRHPKGRWADNSLFMTAKTYRGLYRYSGRKRDIRQSLAYYQRMINRFPDSVLADDALFALAEIELKVRKQEQASLKYYKLIVSRYPKADHYSGAKEAIARLSSARSTTKVRNDKKPEREIKPTTERKTKAKTGSLVDVTRLRFWSNPTYTRIVIDAKNEIPYSYRLLNKDPSIQKPQRLYVDLKNTRVGPKLSTIVPIRDNLLKGARAGQHTRSSVRVVLDIKTIDTFKVFSLYNPFRIVIDINGKGTITDQDGSPGIPHPQALARQLALNVNRIVIDPGHGGKDPGAPGCYKGVVEKDIVLQVSKKLGKKIEAELGCKVYYTRKSDRFLPLEERTAIANTRNADLFLSIHANASMRKGAYGIETYFLNLATDNDAIMVAARENATSARSINDLEMILNDLMRHSKINESSQLAVCVQNALIQQMNRNYGGIRNLGVKQAPFYVLLGAEMPSVLVELGFVSHDKECKRLTMSKYQDQLVNGIVDGIKRYIKKIKAPVI